MEKNKKIACIFNYAPHYRHSIYHMMAKEFGCDFYFGKNLPGGEQLKKMDLAALAGFKQEFKVFQFRYSWQCGVVPQVFKGYRIYILTGSPSLSNIVFMAFAKLLNKKVLLWTHGLKTLDQGKHFLVRFFLNSASGFLLYGNYGKQMMLKYGISESRLFVINNSLDYDRQLEVRKQLVSSALYADKYHNNDPVVIFTGRLMKNKKIEMIFDVQKTLISICPFNLVLVGDGPEKVSLEQKADQLGLTGRVWFYGECYKEQQLGELFYNASLTVSPGNVGLTAIHSLMYGTPVITHDNAVAQMPEYEAVKDGCTGLLFKENDPADLANKIQKWLQNNKDRNETRRRCFQVIDKDYNPYYQINVIKEAIALS